MPPIESETTSATSESSWRGGVHTANRIGDAAWRGAAISPSHATLDRIAEPALRPTLCVALPAGRCLISFYKPFVVTCPAGARTGM